MEVVVGGVQVRWVRRCVSWCVVLFHLRDTCSLHAYRRAQREREREGGRERERKGGREREREQTLQAARGGGVWRQGSRWQMCHYQRPGEIGDVTEEEVPQPRVDVCPASREEPRDEEDLVDGAVSRWDGRTSGGW